MLEHLIALLAQPEAHVCAWRDGELRASLPRWLGHVRSSPIARSESIASAAKHSARSKRWIQSGAPSSRPTPPE